MLLSGGGPLSHHTETDPRLVTATWGSAAAAFVLGMFSPTVSRPFLATSSPWPRHTRPGGPGFSTTF